MERRERRLASAARSGDHDLALGTGDRPGDPALERLGARPKLAAKAAKLMPRVCGVVWTRPQNRNMGRIADYLRGADLLDTESRTLSATASGPGPDLARTISPTPLPTMTEAQALRIADVLRRVPAVLADASPRCRRACTEPPTAVAQPAGDDQRLVQLLRRPCPGRPRRPVLDGDGGPPDRRRRLHRQVPERGHRSPSSPRSIRRRSTSSAAAPGSSTATPRRGRSRCRS